MIKDMNYFLYNPVTQYDNTGDLLINTSLVALLRKHGQVIIDDHDKPETFISALTSAEDQRLSAITQLRLFDFVESRLRQPGQGTYFLVFVPGDLSVVGFGRALSRVRFFYRRLRKLRQLGCRFLRLGISLNTFDFPNMVAESLYSSAFTAYGLRDRQSLALAQRYRFAHARYFPDLAWAYPQQTAHEKPPAHSRYLLLSFRASHAGTRHDHDYFAHIKNQLSALLKHPDFHGYRMIVSYQVKYDREASRELADLFADTFDVEFVDELLSLEKALQLYRKVDLMLSNRLHVLLLGKICQTLAIPVINPEDNKKIAGIYRDNDLYHTVLDYRMAAPRLREQLNTLRQQRDTLLQQAQQVIARNAEIIKNEITDIVCPS